jgi:hypothetical protein
MVGDLHKISAATDDESAVRRISRLQTYQRSLNEAAIISIQQGQVTISRGVNYYDGLIDQSRWPRLSPAQGSDPGGRSLTRAGSRSSLPRQ